MKTASIPLLFAFMTITQTSLAYEAHEWGTFTSLVGSDGKTLHGMYHEDEVLPDFVHGFGETRQLPKPQPEPQRPRPPCRGKGCFDDSFFDNNSITQKMETPVIYFYSDRDVHVDVNVRFPKGIFTDTFPAPVSSYPTRRDVNNLGNGNVTFSVDVRPSLTLNPPKVPVGNIYGHARNVASSPIMSGNEVEKFIFYRGLGEFQPKSIGVRSSQGDLTFVQMTKTPPQAAFLIDVNEAGNTRFMVLNQDGQYLDAATVAVLRTHGVDESEMARAEIAKALQAAGLYADEANAMLDTWEHGYLKVPGLRVLYVLPGFEAHSILPLEMTPAPTRLERVFVGRVEVLLDTVEDGILANILAQREAFVAASLGRFAEPILRRVAQRYTDDDAEVITLLSKLIQTAANPQ